LDSCFRGNDTNHLICDGLQALIYSVNIIHKDLKTQRKSWRNSDLVVKGCPWYIAEGNAVITKEETTYIGNAVVVPLWGMLCRHPVDGNSGENPKRFNVKKYRTPLIH